MGLPFTKRWYDGKIGPADAAVAISDGFPVTSDRTQVGPRIRHYTYTDRQTDTSLSSQLSPPVPASRDLYAVLPTAAVEDEYQLEATDSGASESIHDLSSQMFGKLQTWKRGI
jgi:hypothetical protein